MTSIASQAVQMLAGSFAQQVGTAVARQQVSADRAVAEMVAGTAASASSPAPAGQGKVIDLKV